jgi:hypothetical protein
VEIKERSSSNYKSDNWNDISRIIPICEKRLLKIRDNVSLIDFIKYCKVMDTVKWDSERNIGKKEDMLKLLNHILEETSNSTIDHNEFILKV